MSPRPDRPPSDIPDQERRKAQEALGRVSPQRAWQELSYRVQAAADQGAESYQLIKASEYTGTLDDLGVLMSQYAPEEGVTLFHMANPEFDLGNIPKQDPLEALRGVLKMVMDLDY